MSRVSCEGYACGRKNQCALHLTADRTNEYEHLCSDGTYDAFEAARRSVPAGQWEGTLDIAPRGPFDGLIPKVVEVA